MPLLKFPTAISLTIFLLSLALPSSAQPTAFTYQGRLNLSGSPANGTYDLTFALYDLSSGGTRQGPILTNSAAAISNGLFAISLDFGNQFPGTNRWLEIGVRTNGGGAFSTLSPRQQITSAPYAVQAANALTAAVAASANSVAAANIAGTLADTQLSSNIALRAGGNTFTGGNQNIASGNVGIGTSSPPAPLGFASAIGEKISLYASSPNQIYGFGITNFQLQIHTDTPLADVVFGSGTSTNLTETMRIKGNGNVGIGTTWPSNTLQINTNFALANGYALNVNQASYGENIQINRPAGSGGLGLVLDDAAAGDSSTSLLLVRNNTAPNNGANANTLMTVQAGGNVGISSPSPQRLLQVGDQSVIGSEGLMRFASRSPFGAARIWDVGVPRDTNSTAGKFYSFVIQDTGQPDGEFVIRWDTGYVGIGTTNPAANLDVNGVIHATSFQGNGVLPNQLNGAASIVAQANQAYDLTSASTAIVTLPSSPNVGDTVQVNGLGSGGWQLQAAGGQSFGGYQVGANWFAEGLNLSWFSIACSADGTRLAGATQFGYVYTSTDGGVTWLQRISTQRSAVASSSDGTKLFLAALSGPSAISSDGGATWAFTTTPYFTGGQAAAAMAADGSKIVSVTANGPIWTSSNGGTNWTFHGPTNNWSWVASSSDGSKLVASVNGGAVWTSTDSGSTWTARTINASWTGVASSSDGTKLVAVANGSQIYTSTDSGVSWSVRDNSRAWSSVASSADGTRLVAAVSPGQIYYSTDSGATWTPHAQTLYWKAVTSSALGDRLYAVINGYPYGGQFWASSAEPAGTQGSSATLQYAGNGVWQPLTPAAVSGVAQLQAANTFYGSPNIFMGSVGISNVAPFAPLVVGAGGSAPYCDGTTWVNSSDRKEKENFAPVNRADVLARVASLPMESWNYKARPAHKHIGPMAQDFHAAFGLNGEDDTHINTVDEGGVALAAIQGLNEKVEAHRQKSELLEQKLAQKETEISELRRQLSELKELVKTSKR